jgi:sigma-E factor negative regulatory protein RseC
VNHTVHDAAAALIEGQARVVAVDGAHVWLAAEAPAACGTCATRGGCGTARIGTRAEAARWRTSRRAVPGEAPLALGETVRVGVDRSALARAGLAAYALPLLAMLLAAVALRAAGDIAAIAGALAGLLVGALVARRLARRWQSALEPVVLGRADAARCAPPSHAGERSR